MAISEVWKKHHGRVVAGLAITTAAYLVYRQLAPRESGHKKSQYLRPSRIQGKISALEAQTFSEAFKRCRQGRETSELDHEMAVISELKYETLTCNDAIQFSMADPAAGTLSSELVDDNNKTGEAEVVSKENDNDDNDEEAEYDIDDQEDDDDDESKDGKDKCTDHEGEEESPYDAFSDVIQAVNLSNVGQAALRIRKDRWIAEATGDPTRSKLSDLAYTMDGTPMCGAYNLVIRIDFSDGVKWIARFPGHGTRFQPADVLKMNFEYNTIRYIREHTSIPIPEVFYVTTSSEMAGVPFALMSYVEGNTLSDIWYHEMDESQRLTMLSNIAENMVKLHHLKFDRIGMLDFDRAGKVRGVGPQIAVVQEGDSAWARTQACVPFDNVDAYYKASYNQSEHEHIRVQASVQILRIAVETMPVYLTNEIKFPLTILDMNYQNIIVDEDHNIKAFIDWDGVGSHASVNGCARYPSWITRDWDPALHYYNPDPPVEGHSAEEHSPEELQRFRKHYAQIFTSHADELEDYDPRMTTLSHVVEAIELALSDSFIRPKIVMKMFDVAFDHVQPFKIFEYINDVVAGDTLEKDALIREAFTKAWANEWKEDGLDSPEASTRSSGLGSSYAGLKMFVQNDADVKEDPSLTRGDQSGKLQSEACADVETEENVQKDDKNGCQKDGEESNGEDIQENVVDDILGDSQLDNEEDNLKALFASQTVQLEKDSLVEVKDKQREVSLNYQEAAANDWAATFF